MLKNYFKLAFRNLRKYKIFTLVNIAGLTVALISCIFIALFVLDELNHDRFHKNTAQIYRVRVKDDMLGGYSPSTSWLLSEKLKDEFPEVKETVRIQSMHEPVYFQSGEQMIKESNCLFADNTLFDIFTFPLKIGDSRRALTDPHSVVINRKISEKYFGVQNPVGQTLRANIRSKWYDLQVTGVLEDIPANSDFNVDFMLSWSVLSEMYDRPGRNISEPHPMKTWNIVSAFTFVLLEEACPVADLETKAGDFFQKNIPASYIKHMMFEPLRDMHLYQITADGVKKPGSIVSIYLFSAIGALILLVAGINFVILSTASASVRAKEIGLRKVVGARRTNLVVQFLIESNLLAFLSLLLALFAVELLLPSANALLGKQLDADYFQLWRFILILLGITLTVGLCSGGYVAFYLSGLKPIATLQKKSSADASRSGLRQALIITQFIIFTALLVSSFVIYKQMQFVRETNLGFDKEQLIAIDMGRADFGKHFNAFKNDMLKYPGIVNISAGSTLPLNRTGIMFQETVLPGHPDEKIRYHAGYVGDYDFFKTLNAHVLDGRVFQSEFSQDLSESVVLNEMAVQKFGLKHPVGSLIQLQDGPKRIIGVVDDFIVSCYYETNPLVYYLKPGHPFVYSMILKIKPKNISATLDYLKHKWSEYAPDAVLEFQFVDEELARQYAKDIRFSRIITLFTGLAILIACLGLFGLSLFMVKRKTKELGVRKILGASVFGIVCLLTKDFTRWVIVANFIAWPMAWYAMNKWLQNFAYRIDLTIWPFLLSGLLALIIALLTVSWQAIRAAMANPVESLRYE